MRDPSTFIMKNDNAISEIDLSELESFLEKKLPEVYKDFLLEFNGGILAYNKFKLDSSEEYDNLYSFDSLHKIKESWRYLKSSSDFFNAEIISIAETLGTSFICIGLGKKNFGKIFVVESDLEVKFQANSLVDFMEQIELEQPIEFPPLQSIKK